MKTLIKVGVVLAFLLSGIYGIKQVTHAFSIARIESLDLLYKEEWETPLCAPEQEEELQAILGQSFHLIDSGSECFVFSSTDQQYILKCFKLDLCRFVYFKKGLWREDHSQCAGTISCHPLTTCFLPLPVQYWLKRYLGMREFRLQNTFASCKLAYDKFAKETGFLFLHLNRSKWLPNELRLIDGNGISHNIDPNRIPFVVQKKVVPLETYFAGLVEKGALEEAKCAIDSLCRLIQRRCALGIGDRDCLNRNLGFIGTEAIEIDLGSFYDQPKLKDPRSVAHALKEGTVELKQWLNPRSLELANFLESYYE